jgi:ribulose bisphosphate carboxylase small subunit
MIYLSIGILILAIALLFIGDRQTEKRVQDSYEEGFIDGMEHIIDKRYEQLNELETKKD